MVALTVNLTGKYSVRCTKLAVSFDSMPSWL